MKKINFFLIGMTSVLLAFAMIGCDNGTNTVTKEVPGPGSTTTVTVTDNTHPFSATTPEQLNALVALRAKTPIYVTKDITATEDIDLADGQTIVIADQAYANAQPRPNGVSASFGSVEALVTLTIPVGKKLTVASGAAVVVGDTSNETTATTKTGVLKIAGGAKLSVSGGATLAVTTASHVLVEKVSGTPPSNALADSGLTLFTGANLAFLGITDNNSKVDPIQLVATNSRLDNVFIAIETDNTSISAPAAIPPDIKVYSDYSVDKGTDETKNITEEARKFIADKVAEIEAVSPARITASASEAKNLLESPSNSVTTVTYTGSETSLDVIAATGKTLVIAGTVSAQAAAISVGTLEVTSSGELTTTTSGTITVTTALTNEGTIDLGTDGTIAVTGSGTVTNNGTIKTATALPATGVTNNGVIESTATTEAVLKTHVGASGTGKVVLTGAVNGGGVSAPLALSQNLEIGASGSITFDNAVTGAAFSGSGKTVTIAEGGTLNLGAGVTGLGTATIVNNGTIKTAVTGEGSGAKLKAILDKATGKIEASGAAISVAANTELTVPSGATLTVAASGKLTVADDIIVKGTLDLSALTETSAVALNGTIEVVNGGTLKTPAPESGGSTPEIAYGDNGVTKVNWGGTVVIGTISASATYIGTTAALYTWTDSSTPPSPSIPTAEQYVTLKKDNEMFLHGNLTTANSITVNAGQKATIDASATLTLGAAASVPTISRFFIDGEVIVSGTIKVAATDTTNTQVGWVELRDAASKLTLNPGGKLDIAAGSSVYTASGTGESAPKVTVYSSGNTSEATKAKNTGTSPNFVLVTEPTTGVAVDIILGDLQISITNAASPFTGTTAGTPAAGTLTAGDDTVIVFEKTST